MYQSRLHCQKYRLILQLQIKRRLSCSGLKKEKKDILQRLKNEKRVILHQLQELKKFILQ
jgi:hypothetical protein